MGEANERPSRNDRVNLPMPQQTTELRCPTCSKLLIGLSLDFQGEVGIRCRRCKTEVSYPAGRSPTTKIRCSCRKWLARGVVKAGHIRVYCGRHRALVIAGFTVSIVERPPPVLQLPLEPPGEPEIAAFIEERWKLLRMDRARRNTDIAVGIRFDVFNRDGFRCRYCGRGPDQGCFLEADHVVPRSAGGPDSLANLVTSCSDCNRGKAAKLLTGGPTLA